MDNPYIVKEDVPYTIKKFVTGKPLDANSKEIPDEHGNYPVSPLGFLYDGEGGDLQPLPTMEFGANPSSTVSEKILLGLSGKMYRVAKTPKRLYGTCVVFDIKSMGVSQQDNDSYVIVVDGDIREMDDAMSYAMIGNATKGNDYSSLGIIDSQFTIKWNLNSIVYDEETDCTTVTIGKMPGWRLTGNIGESRIVLKLIKDVWDQSSTDGRYVYCDDTGIVYEVGASDEAKYSIRAKIATASDDKEYIYSADDLVSADADCNGNAHIRNGYSDREVMEWVEEKTAGFLSSGVHPSSKEGDIADAGSLVRWFVSSGNVDISGGMRYPVMVDGFGLGSGYYGYSSSLDHTVSEKPRFYADGSVIDYSTPYGERGCTTGNAATAYVDHPPVGHPVVTFGYSNRHGIESDSGLVALPFDWPFSSNSNSTKNNNITFTGTAVNVGDKSVGGMIGTHTYDICPDCDGMGYINGVMCERCNGTGDVNPVNVDINRAHVCLYNDFTANSEADTSDGYADGSTVLKKTFIHLGAQLNTKDGAEYELTVSLPNINVEDAFNTGDTKKDLSAYYAYVSQPRVYVLGGTWKFSNTHVMVDTPSERTPMVLSGDGVFCDADGQPIADGMSVRFNLQATKMKPYSTEFIGVLVSNSDGRYTIECEEATLPYDIGGRGWCENDMYICGLAYVDDPSDEELNISDTGLGLVSRNDSTINSTDYGDGDATDLNAYNRFFSLDAKDGRQKLADCVDNRYVIATVYPTATNTFPWAIGGRRKLNAIERSLTDEINAHDSILEMAWKANRDIISVDNLPMPMTEGNRAIVRGDIGWSNDGSVLKNFSVEQHNISYATAVSKLASSGVLPRMLRVNLPKYLDEVNTAHDYHGEMYEVVKRANEVVADLANDYRMLRLKYSSSVRNGKSYIPVASDSSGFVWNSAMFGTEAEVADDSVISTIWRMRMRHTPEYIYSASDDPSVSPEEYTYNDYVPFENADNVRELYRTVNSKYQSTLGSTGDIEDIPCDITSAPVKECAFFNRTVFTKHIWVANSQFAGKPYGWDMCREAELQSVSCDADKLAHPYRYRYGSVAKTGFAEIADAYTKIMSVDGVPMPSEKLTLGTVIDLLSEKQRAYVGMDAFASYRYECRDADTDDDFEFVSATLPTSDSELSKFLRTYTPMYAAKMPIRHWDSHRVYVPKGGTTTASEVYYTRLKWLGSKLDQCPDLKTSYANDMFIRNSKAPFTQDNNLSWVSTDTENSTTYLESGASVPPGTISRGIYNGNGFKSEHDGDFAESYIRVFMKFVFSAKAGRWYCADYRQAPVSYLSPLYGAKALDATMPSVYTSNGMPADLTISIDDTTKMVIGVSTNSTERIWKDSICGGYTWKDATRHPYYRYTPMNIAAGVVPFLYGVFPYRGEGAPKKEGNVSTYKKGKLSTNTKFPYYVSVDDDRDGENYMSRLDKPYLPYADGGIGLYPPADCNGGYSESAMTLNSAMANFWSVRTHIRPAVSVLPGTKVPGFYFDDEGDRVVTRDGGSMSDATLWSQYSYPPKGSVKYHFPDPTYPLDDMNDCVLIYKGDDGVGKIQSGSHNNIVYAFKK